MTSSASNAMRTSERFYRTAMRIHVANGDRDTARRLYRQLEAHLTELDVEPDDETAAILEPAARRAV